MAQLPCIDNRHRRIYNYCMVTVGVWDLHNELALYLQYVKNGETVVITEHDKIIAEITEPRKADNENSLEEKLRQLNREGDIILAKETRSCAALPETKEKLDWQKIYNEIRSERA